MVQTVTGEVSPDQLGFVLPHEHIYLDGFTTALSPDLILDDPKTARQELQLYLDAGGTTVVELTIHGLNPDPIGLRSVSEELGVKIVAGTGLYWERFYPSWVQGMSVAALTRFMVTEITNGIAGTDVRAGIIGEIGLSWPPHPNEYMALRAAARAQLRSGAASMTLPRLVNWANAARQGLCEAARQVVRDYARRWVIERWHYTLKSGLRVERLQIDDLLLELGRGAPF